MGSIQDVRTLPVTPDEITTAWLSRMLQKQVQAFEITSAILDQTAGKLFLTLTYDANVDNKQPRHLCLKGSFNPAMMAMEGYSDILLAMYSREVHFYMKVAPKLTTTKLPRVWAAEASTHPPQGILFMEDLNKRGCTFGEPAEPWPVERVRAGVEQLAALHASTWNFTLSDLPGFTPAYEEVMIELTAMWDVVVLGSDRPSIPDYIKDRQRVVAAMKKHYATKNPKFLCLLHGDPHPGNTFIDKHGVPGFLDWQTAHVGSGFHDLTYFVVGSLTVEDRQAHEISILEYYLDKLAENGGPSLSWQDPEVFLEYKKSMMAGMGWVLTPYAMQCKERVVAMVTRYCAAFLDHEVFELVESLPDP